MTSAVTTHILDTTAGVPAGDVPVRLEVRAGQDWTAVASGVTDADGRIRDLGPERLAAGTYRLVFDTAGYLGDAAFFPEVSVCFQLTDDRAHYHVPLLLSPFAYSTYRGS